VTEDDFDGFEQPAGLLEGTVSQVLLLKDALDTGDAAAIVKAFAMVSRICGLDWLATMAGCERSRLLAALSDHESPDLAVLTHIVDRLMIRCEADLGKSDGYRRGLIQENDKDLSCY
jgi:DNA-binding phage protein